MDNVDEYNHVPTIIMNVLIMIISFYLLFLYLKNPNFRVYLLNYNMILSFSIFLDNALRLITKSSGFFCNIQAVLLVFLDKFLLTTITFYVFLLYLGVIHPQYYAQNEKKIFFTTLIINISISLIITITFMIIYEIKEYNICYCGSGDGKVISDTIITFVLIAINLFCLLKLLIYLSEKIKEVAIGKIIDLDYGRHYSKILLMFLTNGLILFATILIINDIVSDGADLLYISTCLVVDLVYSINESVYKMTLKLFCVNYYNKKYPSIKRDDSLSEDDSPKNSRTSSLSEN